MVIQKIGTKISLGFISMLVLVLILGGFTLVSLKDTQGNVRTFQAAQQRLSICMNIENEYIGVVAALRGYIAYGDEKFAKLTEEKFNNVLRLEEQLLAVAEEEKKNDAKELISDTQKYRDGILNTLVPIARKQHQALRAGDVQSADNLREQTVKVALGLVPFTDQITKTLHALVESNDKIVKSQSQKAIGDMAQVVTVAIWLILIALIVGIVLSIVFTRMIRNPISEMLAGAQKYAKGDLSSTITLRSADELGQLGSALNAMRDSFINMIKNIMQSSEQVAASSQQLTASAEQCAQAANQVAVSITDVATGAEKQLHAVNISSTIVHKISDDVQLVAASANEVTGLSDRTSTTAKNGEQAITTAVNQMSNIEKAVNHSAETVIRLGERSKEIGQIVDTISGIAGQTNLLALNAAIEAARAGEQGRGFAVVADEVRKLAEQSQEAAKKIAELISVIQAETDSAVVAMQKGTREVQIGAEVVNTAGSSFTEIENLIETVAARAHQMSQAIQEVANGSKQIVSSVYDIESISKNTAGQTQTVSAATEETSASMEEIASSSQALARLAEELQGQISKFKLA